MLICWSCATFHFVGVKFYIFISRWVKTIRLLHFVCLLRFVSCPYMLPVISKKSHRKKYQIRTSDQRKTCLYRSDLIYQSSFFVSFCVIKNAQSQMNLLIKCVNEIIRRQTFADSYRKLLEMHFKCSLIWFTLFILFFFFLFLVSLFVCILMYLCVRFSHNLCVERRNDTKPKSKNRSKAT